MRNLIVVLSVAVALVLVAPVATADTLEVLTGAAALEGTYGLAVPHDNTSKAYVQDDTPDSEIVYRGSFMFNPNNISPATGNWRQEIFKVTGLNPRPGVGVCHPTNQFGDAVKLFLVMVNGGADYKIQGWVFGNQCGARGLNNIPIATDQPVKICWEWEALSTDAGRLAVAVTDTASACPTSGDPAWVERTTTNHDTAVTSVRLGTPSQNNFGAGENGTMYFDSFESYRTMTP